MKHFLIAAAVSAVFIPAGAAAQTADLPPAGSCIDIEVPDDIRIGGYMVINNCPQGITHHFAIWDHSSAPAYNSCYNSKILGVGSGIPLEARPLPGENQHYRYKYYNSYFDGFLNHLINWCHDYSTSFAITNDEDKRRMDAANKANKRYGLCKDRLYNDPKKRPTGCNNPH